MEMVGITYTIMTSPLGRILVARSAEGLTCINFQDGTEPVSSDGWREQAQPGWSHAAGSLFPRRLQQSESPVPQGTTFQRQVWQAMHHPIWGL
jgi:O6-methylguanine-DNA--protein-cysteine methyltransferase